MYVQVLKTYDVITRLRVSSGSLCTGTYIYGTARCCGASFAYNHLYTCNMIDWYASSSNNDVVFLPIVYESDRPSQIDDDMNNLLATSAIGLCVVRKRKRRHKCR